MNFDELRELTEVIQDTTMEEISGGVVDWVIVSF